MFYKQNLHSNFSKETYINQNLLLTPSVGQKLLAIFRLA
ncbi:hypothetical protein M23134_03412 [Microscilla marina ATCC 23134]|uniref:Uncharacterized protein n=1 Tax=Microscilla marina ATCC 23134 TaxID=313606 RepID=A1ZMX0_MICM2|nr:hypothetical protein M23134_03412 [Microscilla marina ATCC 23134]